MTAVTDRRTAPDANSFRPEDLLHLSDEEFRAVVDADLRRHAPKSGVTLRPDLIAALRTLEVAPRWHAMLLRLQKSVDGQLGARECDYQAEKAKLEGEIQRMTDKVERGEDVHDGDSRRVLDPDEVQRRLSSLKLRALALRASHMKSKAGTVRFKTGLDDVTLEARFLRDQAVGATFETAVALERDFYANRTRTLAEAIVAHQTAVKDDLEGDEPDEIDTALWGVLTPTESVPHCGGLHETHAGRGPGSQRP